MTATVDETTATTTEEEEPVFATGGRAASRRQTEEKKRREAARKAAWNTFDYLRLNPPGDNDEFGESIIVRFVTDEPDWIETLQHSFIRTRPAPADKPSDKQWLERFGAVCRYTLVPKGSNSNGEPILKQWYDDCYICDNVTKKVKRKGAEVDVPETGQPKMWAVAVEREEVIGTEEMVKAGEIESWQVDDVVSYRDKLVEHVDAEGNKELRPHYLVINQGMKNFFDKLLGFVAVYKNVVDRDYKITRTGSGTDTDYDIVPLAPVTVTVNGKQVKFDLRNPLFKDQYNPPFSLNKIVAAQASKEHYDWYFDPTAEISWEARFGKKDDSDGDNNNSPSKSDSADDANSREVLAAMRDKIKSRS